jgi:ATP-dependent DNA ligase
MLARLAATLPLGCEWRYEPKFDGFRGLLWRAPGGTVRLLSRNLKDLSASFPELVYAGDALPPSTVVDGEIVIAEVDGRSDFGALQARLGAGKRDAGRIVSRKPAVLLVFDVICHERADLTDMRLSDR